MRRLRLVGIVCLLTFVFLWLVVPYLLEKLIQQELLQLGADEVDVDLTIRPAGWKGHAWIRWSASGIDRLEANVDGSWSSLLAGRAHRLTGSARVDLTSLKRQRERDASGSSLAVWIRRLSDSGNRLQNWLSKIPIEIVDPFKLELTWPLGTTNIRADVDISGAIQQTPCPALTVYLFDHWSGAKANAAFIYSNTLRSRIDLKLPHHSPIWSNYLSAFGLKPEQVIVGGAGVYSEAVWTERNAEPHFDFRFDLQPLIGTMELSRAKMCSYLDGHVEASLSPQQAAGRVDLKCNTDVSGIFIESLNRIDALLGLDEEKRRCIGWHWGRSFQRVIIAC